MHHPNALIMFFDFDPIGIQNQRNAIKVLLQRRGLEPLVQQPKKTFKRAAVHLISKNIKTLYSVLN